MAAKTRFLIEQWCIIVGFVALAITVVVLGVTHTYLDDLSIAWIVMAVAVALILGYNALMVCRQCIGGILTRRCDVDGYEQVYHFVYGKSRRASVLKDSLYENFCIAFFQGKFDQVLQISVRLSAQDFHTHNELNAYFAYSAYQLGNEEALRFAVEEATKELPTKRKNDIIGEMSMGAVGYCLAMFEGRASDALTCFPPRQYRRSDRYFWCFGRYCFAEAERALGNEEVANQILSELTKFGSLWFCKKAREKLSCKESTSIENEKK